MKPICFQPNDDGLSGNATRAKVVSSPVSGLMLQEEE